MLPELLKFSQELFIMQQFPREDLQTAEVPSQALYCGKTKNKKKQSLRPPVTSSLSPNHDVLSK